MCFFFFLRPKVAILADFNLHLMQAYGAIKKHPFLVAEALSHLTERQADYYDVRKQNPSELDEVSRAARFIFLNRNCFNGVYRTNKSGVFNVPKGTRVGSMPTREHLFRCSVALRSAQLENGDFEETIDTAKSGDFIYADPPYAKWHARSRGEYGPGAFAVSDINRLNEALVRADSRKASFLLSYIDCEEIRILKARWRSHQVKVHRQISGFEQHRYVVTEVLITNQMRFRAPK
jgi:DNA adenine methylase